ncbi:hypothetical protein SDRG_16703 [Saprolegnia diclina VS20]|uniref:Pirin n=1 Tax=Saprolegnia diclina (strain VS20) TaxID=1156394 RepID=T0R7H8_SAPDV|nr:hypothetical protein SDRG_16703 [Saprolegnia diclina VS20]EQC25437.1 hypothetical protein SDRG_16703 [Saprolegnia diclina VS20]|eukprot:XP_008621143.1 hypothetical protein SDRG_16703 [Saprolegnia diclina VS20]
MRTIRVVDANIAHPFGDDRTVIQAFPRAIPSEESDPFLMCDHLIIESDGRAAHADDFPIGWHPHRGMDIMTYLKRGTGRHGDSMGNREEFAAPGMQWISCGSGIEHAEGGANNAGEIEEGFQIWLNVPAKHKMDDPSYGTEDPATIPQVELSPGVQARLLAGPFADGRTGQFKTKQFVQMVDFELSPSSTLTYDIPAGMDTCMLFVYEGDALLNTAPIRINQVALLDATNEAKRTFELTARSKAVSAMLFAGKKIKEPIAWHGPIVMNTQAQIRECFNDMRSGKFPPKRAPWDYKTLSAFPADKKPTQ